MALVTQKSFAGSQPLTHVPTPSSTTLVKKRRTIRPAASMPTNDPKDSVHASTSTTTPPP